MATTTEVIEAAAAKKLDLLDHDVPRFAVRAILAGVYLTLATAFAAVAGQIVNGVAPGMGAIVFALFFGIGLFAIVILGAELATGNMMFLSYSATNRRVSWGKAIMLVAVTTFFNLVGAVAVAWLMSQSAKLGHIPPTHFMATTAAAKVAKAPWGLLCEGILANFVVNMALLGAAKAQDYVSKFFTIVFILAIFVGLSFEHVIANFSLMSMTMFSANPWPEGFTLGTVLLNWLIVFIGNFIGGGLLIGALYAWLNRSKTSYAD